MKSRECFEIEISNKVTGGERLPWQEMRNTGKCQSMQKAWLVLNTDVVTSLNRAHR